MNGPRSVTPEVADPTTPSSDTIALLERLVAIDTTSRNSNLELIGFAREWLESLGATCALTPSPDGRKANLLATFGPADRPGVLLSGHTDVVPVDGQDWHTDPFVLTRIEDRYHARGACDMKGFIAAVLAAAPNFARVGLAEPIHIALTYDEEIGCLGVPVLIRAMREMAALPRLAIIGEPTGMQVAIGHKGARAFAASFRGREAHSSLAPLAVNAVEHAAELVSRLTRLGREFADHGPFDDDYDVGHATVHTGVFHGGTQVNIVPARCELEFEYRPLPGIDEDGPEHLVRDWIENEIEPAMQWRDPDCGIDLERRYAYPGLATPHDAEVTRITRALAGAAEPVKIAFGTEAGCYHTDLGIPSVVCGPGSIRQAHQRDEYVSAAQLACCDRFMHRLTDLVAAHR
jgi:acetylornithine deacetylase